MPKDLYMCQLCANHGQYNQPKKGHKQKCPNRDCMCSLCSLNLKRRFLDRIERKIRKENDNEHQNSENVEKCADNKVLDKMSTSNFAQSTPQSTQKTKNKEQQKCQKHSSPKHSTLHVFHSIELLLAG
uniref:DM domain-containing protein n=1 Tax=Meloidogyne javanica TaxID=6303 RepID=A0A915MLI9_MELJA